MIAALAGLARTTPRTARRLVARIRANACSIEDAKLNRIGCALSSTLGQFNHSCSPNVAVTLRGGRVVVSAVADIDVGEELSVSYVDAKEHLANRQAQLAHYGFVCICTRCTQEGKACSDVD